MLLTSLFIHTHTHTRHIVSTHIPTELYSFRTTEEQAITFATFSAAVSCQHLLSYCCYLPLIMNVHTKRNRRFMLYYFFFRTAVYEGTFACTHIWGSGGWGVTFINRSTRRCVAAGNLFFLFLIFCLSIAASYNLLLFS